VRREAGLIVMGGYERLVITPPLVVTEAEITEIVGRLRGVLRAHYR
jgi:adenosylmethionine-8-amino-7-oxononanoate aminotransferase